MNINLLSVANFIETLMAKIIFRKCVQLIRLQENLLSPLFGGLEPRFVTPGLVTDRVSVGSGSGLCLGHPDYHSPLTNRHHHSHDSHQWFPRTRLSFQSMLDCAHCSNEANCVSVVFSQYYFEFGGRKCHQQLHH